MRTRRKDSIIQKRSFEFALKIIGLYGLLVNQREFVLSKQLLRSGTSVGANIAEATAAVSRKDFIYKMAIASKEAREIVLVATFRSEPISGNRLQQIFG